MTMRKPDPSEIAARDQADMEARARIVGIGTATVTNGTWYTEHWFFDIPEGHPLHGRFPDGPSQLPPFDYVPADYDAWGVGWTGRQLVEIATLERDYRV